MRKKTQIKEEEKEIKVDNNWRMNKLTWRTKAISTTSSFAYPIESPTRCLKTV